MRADGTMDLNDRRNLKVLEKYLEDEEDFDRWAASLPPDELLYAEWLLAESIKEDELVDAFRGNVERLQVKPKLRLIQGGKA